MRLCQLCDWPLVSPHHQQKDLNKQVSNTFLKGYYSQAVSYHTVVRHNNNIQKAPLNTGLFGLDTLIFLLYLFNYYLAATHTIPAVQTLIASAASHRYMPAGITSRRVTLHLAALGIYSV